MSATIPTQPIAQGTLQSIRQSSRPPYGKAELSRLIRPQSVAIIGASATPGSFGYRSLENTAFGYVGRVYPVNPKHAEIAGRKCYATIEDIGETPDCVVLAVPREQVISLVERCAALGVGGVVIYSSGFMETGKPDDIAQQHQLASIARSTGIRIVGPNCVGIMNFVDRVGMTFQPGLNKLPIVTGPIGLVVQSGALAFTLTQGMQRGIGFSYSFAPGNSCDVDVCDLINFLVEDDTTKAIGCVFEGVQDGERLVEVGRRALDAGKPVIAFKLGNNELSRRTAMSHTGTLTGTAAAYAAAFERAGIIPVEDFESVVETTRFFSVSGRPSARGVGVMSGSGGAVVMAADKAEHAGVPLPPLAAETYDKLKEKIPDFASIANPCDITTAAQRDKTMFEHCLRAFTEDPSFSTVIVAITAAYIPTTVERAECISRLARTLNKPMCVVWLNEWYEGPGSEVLDHGIHLAVFRSMKRCFATVKAWIDYHDRRERLLSAAAPRITGAECAKNANAILAECRSGQPLTERLSKRLLAAYGVTVTRERLAVNGARAIEIAQEIGYPVALKAESEAIPHKTDAGVIRLNLTGAEQVADAYNEILGSAARLPGMPTVNGVLVQEMIVGGVEVMVGTRHDPQFGAIVVCGLGGVLVEVLKDTACALAPVGKGEALTMLQSLKGYRLLTGFRGSKPAAIDALVDAICRISELAADLGEKLSEMDINPILAGENRAIAVDALAIIQ